MYSIRNAPVRILGESNHDAAYERLHLRVASTEEGNVLTEDQQWPKLALIVDISKEVWKT